MAKTSRIVKAEKFKREHWQSGYDAFIEAKSELHGAKDKYRWAAHEMIDSMKQCTVAEAYELDLIKFNFATEGLTKRDVLRALGTPEK